MARVHHVTERMAVRRLIAVHRELAALSSVPVSETTDPSIRQARSDYEQDLGVEFRELRDFIRAAKEFETA